MAATALLNTTASLEGEEDEFPRHVVYNDLSDIWNWCYVGIAGVWLAIGVPGNFLIILSCIVFKEMRTIPMALAANLAVSDLIVCSTNVASSWVTFLYDRAFFIRYSVVCTVYGFICGLGCFCSIASICNIAINRYVAICHHEMYPKIYNWCTLPFHLLTSWAAGMVVIAPAVVNFMGAHFDYDRRQGICARSYYVESGYSPVQWWEAVLVVPVSASIIIFTYTKIFSKVRQSSKNVQKGGAEEAKTFTPRDLQLMKTLVLIFVIFISANFPWFVLVNFDFNEQAHHSLYYLTVWLFHTGSNLNPIIYAAKYPEFRESFKKIIKVVTCGCLFGN